MDGMTIDEVIKYFDDDAKENEKLAIIYRGNDDDLAEMHKHDAIRSSYVAEWLRELNTYREFADWLVKAVLEEDWEESADFYAEVLCRKLTKLGKLKVVDNKYMEVKADGDSD